MSPTLCVVGLVFSRIIGKSSELPYDTKSPPGRMHRVCPSEARVRKRRGNCRLKATRLRRRILLCRILIQLLRVIRQRALVLEFLPDLI